MALITGLLYYPKYIYIVLQIWSTKCGSIKRRKSLPSELLTVFLPAAPAQVNNSCCSCGERVQNRGLEARYGHGPLHNYCWEYKKKVILFNDLWPWRSFEVTVRSFSFKSIIKYTVSILDYNVSNYCLTLKTTFIDLEVIQGHHLNCCRSGRNFFSYLIRRETFKKEKAFLSFILCTRLFPNRVAAAALRGLSLFHGGKSYWMDRCRCGPGTVSRHMMGAIFVQLNLLMSPRRKAESSHREAVVTR